MIVALSHFHFRHSLQRVTLGQPYPLLHQYHAAMAINIKKILCALVLDGFTMSARLLNVCSYILVMKTLEDEWYVVIKATSVLNQIF